MNLSYAADYMHIYAAVPKPGIEQKWPIKVFPAINPKQ